MSLPTKNNKPYIIFFVIAIFIFGFYLGNKTNVFANPNFQSQHESISDADFQLYWEALQIFEKHPDAQDISSQEKIWASIAGLAKSYGDPYTVFFNPEETEVFEEDITGEFSGVGMEVDVVDQYLTVIAPLKGSPAERSGILAGDIVVAIDGESTFDQSVDSSVKRIRGPKGEQVELTILREGEEEFRTITIVRDIIEMISVETEIIDDVFIIRLYSFAENSEEKFSQAMNEFIASKKTKLILDVRNNPGGYLSSSITIASWFVPQGKVIVTESFSPQSSKKDISYRSKGAPAPLPKDLKMVVLVDGGSASASEIIAGALQEYKIATLLGTKTYGKGSVQEYIGLGKNTALKVTVARWLTPLKNSIEENGLVPDVEVLYDMTTQGDIQQEKALELLRNK